MPQTKVLLLSEAYLLPMIPIVFNIYARQELAKFIMSGVNPLPHPDEFAKAIDQMYVDDFDTLIDIVYYCGYLGGCYEKGIVPTLKPPLKAKNKESVWIDFISAEGVFLEFSTKIPEGKENEVRYEDILSYAFGEMGLSPNSFYRMTMAEYAAACNGYFWKRWRPDENLRMILYSIKAAFRGKKDTMPSSVEAFYPLPTDKANVSFMKHDEIKKMWEIAKKM